MTPIHSRRIGAAAAVALAAALAAPGHALTRDDLTFSGLLDVALASRGGGYDLNRLNMGNTAFDAYRLRLFVAARPQSALEVHAQLFFDDVTGAGVAGAHVDVAPLPGRDLHLVAGKIASPLGTYAPRTYSDEKPLIGTPLMHQYHTTLRPDALPPDADALLAAAGGGNHPVSYGPGDPGFHGMPVLYDHCWDFGALVQGSARPLEFAAGVTYGTPSAPQTVSDDNRGRTVLGRIGVLPHPAVRLGLSAAHGPWLPAALDGSLPAGRTAGDYPQRLVMADAALTAGRVDLIAEAVRNRWATPGLGDLDVDGWYLEARAGLGATGYVAARWDALRFSDLAGSSGAPRPWDDDVDRVEAGAGVRLSRETLVKAVWQRTERTGPARVRRDDLYALQVSLRFR